MSLFFLTFLSMYGGVHVYAFLRARSVLGFGFGPGAGLAVFMLAMTAAPVVVRVLERQGYELSARAFSYLAYLWMAALFLFFCGSVFLDLINLVFRIAGWALRLDIKAALIPTGISFIGTACLSLLICIYGYVDAGNIRTERLVIETTKLPAGTDRLTIVQISDVHLGLIVRCDKLDRILDAVRVAQPDLLVSTGDLVDAQINHLPGLAERLRTITPKYGKFAITGNHEYYAGLEKALAFTKNAGFTLLRGEAKDIGALVIACVDDPAALQMKLGRPASDYSVLSTTDRKKFRLFLKHQPRVSPEAVGLFDLQLSGHTHKGQIWPFTYLSALTYPMNAGRYELPGNAILYVSRGSGTWGPPIRFLSPPEVTVIELVRKSS